MIATGAISPPALPNELFSLIKAGNAQGLNQLLTTTPVDINQQSGNYEDGLEAEEVPPIPLYVAAYLKHTEVVHVLLQHGAIQYEPENNCSSFFEVFLRAPLKTDNLEATLQITKDIFDAGFIIEESIFESELGVFTEFKKPSMSLKSHLFKEIVQQYYFSKCINYIAQNDIQNLNALLDKVQNKWMLAPYSNQPICTINIDLNMDGGLRGMPLMIAATLPSSDMLWHLIYQHQVNPAACDTMGFNALHYAARWGMIQNVRSFALRARLWRQVPLFKQLINQTDHVNGETPLHLAAAYGHATVVELLLKEGADPAIKNQKQKTAVELSVDPEIKKLFTTHSLQTPKTVRFSSSSSKKDTGSQPIAANVEEASSSRDSSMRLALEASHKPK